MRDVERLRKPMQRISDYLIRQMSGSLETVDEVVQRNKGFSWCSLFKNSKHLNRLLLRFLKKPVSTYQGNNSI
ncbi:MAG: hypothetical protein LEGION0403_FIIPPAGN_00436 [Legionella sp.]